MHQVAKDEAKTAIFRLYEPSLWSWTLHDTLPHHDTLVTIWCLAQQACGRTHGVKQHYRYKWTLALALVTQGWAVHKTLLGQNPDTHECIHTHTFKHTHSNIHTHTYTPNTHSNIDTYTHTHACTLKPTHTHTHSNTCMRMCAYTHTYTVIPM